jgi:hypothetical protein
MLVSKAVQAAMFTERGEPTAIGSIPWTDPLDEVLPP